MMNHQVKYGIPDSIKNHERSEYMWEEKKRRMGMKKRTKISIPTEKKQETVQIIWRTNTNKHGNKFVYNINS